MGIPYYFSFLIKNHKNIINNLHNINNIDNLYLDCNSIIYDSIDFKEFENSVVFEKKLIEKIIFKIKLILETIKPKKKIIIAFDGVPPFAKISQQKTRRYKSHYESILKSKSLIWDTCCITPGTNFMNNLNIQITDYFKNNTKILLTLSDIPGEGEHKIFEYIRNSDHSNDSTIIYGMDADLIMLALNHLQYCKNIYLYRETPIFIKSLNSSLNPEEKYIIDINLLGNIIYSELVNNKEELLTKEEFYYNKIKDYVFICFMLGNDFLPHFPSINIRINGITILLELYKSLFNNKFLTKNNNIIWSNLKLFISKLASNEFNFLKNIYDIREKKNNKYYLLNTEEDIENKLLNLPSIDTSVEKFINIFEDNWEFRYYYSLFDTNIDENKNIIGNICINYLQTLQWTLNYYSCDCKNWSHYYKYNYPPLLIDLVKHIPYFDSEIILKEDNNIIHHYLLLSYVLPKKSLNLLPKKIHDYLLRNYSEHYQENYNIEYAYCKYFWEGHVKFPDLDINEFFQNINKLFL